MLLIFKYSLIFNIFREYVYRKLAKSLREHYLRTACSSFLNNLCIYSFRCVQGKRVGGEGGTWVC